MVKSEFNIGEGFTPCPDRVAVIGGGRWARVLIETLCKHLSPSVDVTVHSPHNADAMSEWITASGFRGRVNVFSGWPRKTPTVSIAAIVANAAHDHEKTVATMLSVGIPVLVEKPMAGNVVAAQQLVELACNRKVRFATAHVFLFLESMHRFSNLIAQTGNIQFIHIVWEDPKAENRYGEEKHYDSSLPIFADWLPHISAILNLLQPGAFQQCDEVEFLDGGAQLVLKLRLEDIPCRIQLVRNGSQRRRMIEVYTEGDVLRLDFSKDPGTITSDSIEIENTAYGDERKRPVAQMLIAFLKWAAGGVFDSRLESKVGLRASQLIEQVKVFYREALAPWLIEKILSQKCEGEDFHYALSELLQSQGTLSKESVERQIKIVRQEFTGPRAAHWRKELGDSMDPVALLITIVVNSEVRN